MPAVHVIAYGFACWLAGGICVAAVFHLAKRHYSGGKP